MRYGFASLPQFNEKPGEFADLLHRLQTSDLRHVLLRFFPFVVVSSLSFFNEEALRAVSTHSESCT